MIAGEMKTRQNKGNNKKQVSKQTSIGLTGKWRKREKRKV
jgi:hypothetical protein